MRRKHAVLTPLIAPALPFHCSIKCAEADFYEHLMQQLVA